MTHNNSEIFFNTLAGANPWDVFMGLSPVVQLLTGLVLLIGIVALVITVVRLASSAKGKNGLLSFAAVAAPILAILAVLYDGFRTYAGYTMVHATRIAILFPTIIECGQILILGFVVAAIATAGNRPGRR